jgi:aspartate/methionine/tyrosine aminotransferase
MTCSLTKAYGLDGLRCGWAIANADVAKAMWRLQDFFGVNGTIPAERTSVVALEHIDRFVERTRAIIGRNRPLIEAFMGQHREQLDWVVPDAGPVCFPRLRAGSAEGLCERLRAQFDVGVIPGHFFGMPEHFRLGFGGPTEELRAGLERLSECLALG